MTQCFCSGIIYFENDDFDATFTFETPHAYALSINQGIKKTVNSFLFMFMQERIKLLNWRKKD